MTHRRTILLAVLIAFLFVGGILFPHAANAGIFFIGDQLLNTLVIDPLYGILKALGWILALAGSFVNFTIRPGPLVWSNVVQIGWTITRDFANMFFILILLGIALDYILFQSFGVRRALPRLLLVALLINFSLPIAGVVLDFANVFTAYFTEQVSQGCGTTTSTCAFSQAIAQRIALQNILNAGTLDTAANALAVNSSIFLDIIFSIFFILGTIFIFFALGLMFLLRAGYLMILLILLPLVLVLWAFPPTAGRFGAWTHSFLRWTMFAPVATFFLYLSLLTFTGISTAPFVGGVAVSSASSPLFAFPVSPAMADISSPAISSSDNFFTNGMKYIVAWMFMLGSLYAANSFGIRGASTALAGFSRAGRWARGRASQAGRATTRAAGRAVKIDERLGTLSSSIQRAVPGWVGGGMLARAVSRTAERTKGAIAPAKLTKEEEELIRGMNTKKRAEYHETLLQSKLASNQAKAAQVGAMRADKNELKVLDEYGNVHEGKTKDLLERSYAAAQASKNESARKKIAMTNPDWAHERITEDYMKDLSKLIVKTDAQGKTIDWQEKETGKLLSEAQKEIFENMTTQTFENVKWTAKGVEGYLKSGAASTGHLRMAENAGNEEFIRLIGELSSQPTIMEELERKAPQFARYLESGRAFDNFGIGTSAQKLKEAAEELKKAAGEKEGSDKTKDSK